MNQSRDISIIGGGLLGMTIAMELQKKGYRVSIFEASESLGGLAKSWRIGDMSWDQFYHVILMSDLNTRNLLRELGIENEINWVETKTGFYIDGKLYSMSNTLEFLKFPPLGFISKLRLGLTIFVASVIKNWRLLEEKHVEDWLKKWSGRKTFEKIWLPLLRAKLGEDYHETSASFIWATIQRMYAARKSGLKKEMFGYVNGGYKKVIDTYVNYLSDAGVQIYSDHQLISMFSIEGKHELIFSNGRTVCSETVILTIPSPVIVECWKNMPTNERERHKSIRYLGVSCTSVLIKKDLSPYYVTNITDPDIPFTGVIEMSTLVHKHMLNNCALVYLPKYAGINDDIFIRPDDEIHAEFKEALIKMYDHLCEDDIIEMKTAKVQNVLALNTINYSKFLPDTKSSVQGVYYANSAFITNSTLNVNETVGIGLKICNLYF